MHKNTAFMEKHFQYTYTSISTYLQEKVKTEDTSLWIMSSGLPAIHQWKQITTNSLKRGCKTYGISEWRYDFLHHTHTESSVCSWGLENLEWWKGWSAVTNDFSVRIDKGICVISEMDTGRFWKQLDFGKVKDSKTPKFKTVMDCLTWWHGGKAQMTGDTENVHCFPLICVLHPNTFHWSEGYINYMVTIQH